MDNTRTEFIRAATWYGPLDEAEKILAANPHLANADIHTSAITGNAEAVALFLEADVALAHIVSEPYGATPLVHLCFSKYLRLHPEKTNDFMRIAQLLLDAGADPNAGFRSTGQYPEWETALYGAAGVAYHVPLTRLLLQYGADPNDNETSYHSAECYDMELLKVLVESGRLTRDNLSLMLIRKLDWHDEAGVQYLLDHGADVNWHRSWGLHPLHHSIVRGNSINIITRLLDHGADVPHQSEGINARARAAREGRADVLRLFAERGINPEVEDIDQLTAALALDDSDAVVNIMAKAPYLHDVLRRRGSELLARFCLNGNAAGVHQLLAAGIPANAPYFHGDGYFEIPAGSLPIHIAAWLGREEVVEVLLQHGALSNQPDPKGNMPLALARKAKSESYWKERVEDRLVEMLEKVQSS